MSLFCPTQSAPCWKTLFGCLWGCVQVMCSLWQATMKPSDSCLPGPIMSGNLVFYNSGNLLGKILLLCSLTGVTDGLCLFELWETSRAITLPVKGLVLAVCLVVKGLKNCFYRRRQACPPFSCVYCVKVDLTALSKCVCVCVYISIDIYMLAARWHLLSLLPSQFPVEAAQSNISVAMPTVKPHPVSYTQPPNTFCS